MESKYSPILRSSSLAICLALASCTTEVVQVPVNPSTYPIKYDLSYPHDPAAVVVRTCDQLVSQPDAHRLCMMRGIDRLEVTPRPIPQGGCATGIPCGSHLSVTPPPPVGASTLIVR